ncbi:MAG: glycosyltransferase family 2 protein [Candidatus Omnitrophica bacterium]|nr:glycosyltransferase family 2 protein [Candidatus Omnitrophota bacterium]
MGDVKVSAIIPLYNKAKYIDRAIRSVLTQRGAEVEVIVVDDGSTDGSGSLVMAMQDPRIRYIRQDNAGVSAARNRGIGESSAAFVSFLDADDEWKQGYLETILRLIQAFPEAGLYATAYEIKPVGGKAYLPRYRAVPASPWEGVLPDYFDTALGVPAVWTSAVTVRKEILNDVGMFPLGEKRSEDLDLWARVALKYPMVFSHFVGAVYYQDVDIRASHISNAVTERVVVKTLKDHLSHCQGKAKSIYIEEYINAKVLDSVAECVCAGDGRQARRLLASCPTKFSWKRSFCWYILSYFPASLISTLFAARNLFWK